MKHKIAATLIAVAIPLALAMPTAAQAATFAAPSTYIGETGNSKAEFTSTREGFTVSPEGASVPSTAAFSYLNKATIPAFFTGSETNKRSLTFTNDEKSPYTVKDIKAVIAAATYSSAQETTQVVKVGTSVLAKPVASVTVPAGKTVTVTFITKDPLVTATRSNTAGEVTGVGSDTRFTFTVGTQSLGFEEVIGLGSADADQDSTNASSTKQLFPDCDGDASTLTLCGLAAGATVRTTSLPTTAVTGGASTGSGVPVTGRVVDTIGDPVEGVTVTIVNSSAPSTGSGTDVPPAVTSSTGGYTFPAIPSGGYTITVTAPEGTEVTETPAPFTVDDSSSVTLTDTVLSDDSAVPAGAGSTASNDPAVSDATPAGSSNAGDASAGSSAAAEFWSACQNPAPLFAGTGVLGVLIIAIAVFLTLARLQRAANTKRELEGKEATNLTVEQYEKLRRTPEDRITEPASAAPAPKAPPAFPTTTTAKDTK